MKLDVYSKILDLIKVSYIAQEYVSNENNGTYKPAESKKLLFQIGTQFSILVEEIEEKLINELDVNMIEGRTVIDKYCEGVQDKISEEYNRLILTLKGLDIEKDLPEKLEGFIDRFTYESFNDFKEVITIDPVELLMLIAGKLSHISLDVQGWQSRNFSLEGTADKATVFLYIEFSGLRKQMEQLIHSSSLKYTKVQLAKMISRLTATNYTYYQTLLTQIDWFYSGLKAQPFTDEMVYDAIQLLKKDGLDFSILEQLFDKNFRNK